MKKILFLIICLIFLAFQHTQVSAYDPIPSNLKQYCDIEMGTKAIKAGQPCTYFDSASNKIVCYTAGPDSNLGTYSSVCCDTQSHCNSLNPTPASFTTPKSEAYSSPAKSLSDQCNNSSSETLKNQCNVCMKDNDKIWTAIGCIDPTAQGLISKFLPFGIGIAGGIALLLILFGALQMMISAGNPEKLNAGKELVGAAITGLLFIIFSIFILKLVGVDILSIPGFG